MKMSEEELGKIQIGGKTWREGRVFYKKLLIETTEMLLGAGEDRWGNLKYERLHLFRECSF